MKHLLSSAGVLFVIVLAAKVEGQQQPKEKFILSKLEQDVLDLTNQERAAQELPALKPNPLLFQIARAHTDNMAKQAKRNHGLEDKTPLDRIKDAGYKFAWA